MLAAPDEPEKAAEIKLEHVKPLLQVAIKHYDFVVLDIGRSLDTISIQCLDHADYIFPVLQQTLPFIRDAKRLINTFFSLGYPAEKIQVNCHRYDKKDEITLADVASTLKLEVYKAIPNDYSVVAESVNKGIPVIKLAKRSLVAKSLHELVQEMARAKFDAVTPIVAHHLPTAQPDAGFYLWARTPGPDTAFARRLQHEYNVTVLPGSFLARVANGINPGAGFVRIALVAPLEDCVEAAKRIAACCANLS